MLVKNTYRYCQSVIPPRVCQQIINHGLSQQVTMGSVGNRSIDELNEKEKNDLKTHRHSNVSFIDGEWIFKWIRPYLKEANAIAEWNYDINRFEMMQFTVYNPGQHYDWHSDYHWKDDATKDVRKISMTLSLSDPMDYDGGELEFIKNDVPSESKTIKCIEIKPQGSIVFFPSYVVHKVNPVTRGTRYSLVVWFRGPIWR